VTRSTDEVLRTLWELARAGDESAYREFLTQIAALLRQYVQRQLTRLGRTREETEDIVQEALLAIHKKRHVYDGAVPIQAFAYTLARYKMIDFLRASEHDTHLLAIDDVDDMIAAENGELELNLAVRNSLQALPEKMRQSIALTKMQGMSTNEAANIIGTSNSAIKVNVHRGLRLLAKALR